MKKSFKFLLSVTSLMVLISIVSSAQVSKLKLTQIQGLSPSLTADELNRNIGVTSNIQTQLNAKPNTADAVDATTLFYTKKQSEALNLHNNLLSALNMVGTTVKALPWGVNSAIQLFNGTSALTDAQACYVMFEVKDTITSTGVGWVQASQQGSYTADAYSGFGLYSVSAGTWTKITQTADDAALFKVTAYGTGTKAWPTTQTLLPGIYIVGILWNASATSTAPNMYTWGTMTTNQTVLMTNGNKISSHVTGQTALPASITASGTTANATFFGIWLY